MRKLIEQEIGKVFPAYEPLFGNEPTCDEFKAIKNAEVDSAMLQLKNTNGELVYGYMRKDDALALFDLAFNLPGNVIELGTFMGMSAFIIGQALVSKNSNAEFISIDLDEGSQQIARERFALERFNIDLINKNANDMLIDYMTIGKEFGLAFVDHSHEEKEMSLALNLLGGVMADGSYVMCHDYNDRRNLDPKFPEYGVYQAVEKQEMFEFVDTVGCSAILRTRR